MDVVRHELGFSSKEKRFPRKDACLAIYSYRVNTRLSLKQTLEEQFPWVREWEQDLTKIYREYVARKQKNNVLDFDDLLLYWHGMMKNPALAQGLAANFDHVLVDEYQDTSSLQSEIIQALKPDGAGVTVVGDDAQAIYSFRAAAVENILGFAERFKPKADTVVLSQNYRSTQPILDVANALMSEGARQHRKTLLGMRQAQQKPIYVSLEDAASQAEYIVNKILATREVGGALRRHAILFRSSHHSDVLEVELVRRNVPFVKYGGLKFLEAAHVKDVMSVLRWCDNPRNSVAGFRVLKLVPGIGPAHAKQVLEHLDDAAFSRMGDLEQLEHLSTQHATRERFLTDLTLDPPAVTSDQSGVASKDDDYVVLSTIHSAKGQEWDFVYVLNVADGNFPSEFSNGKPELVEEERRLLYVAMTRARNELHVCAPLKYAVTQQAKDGDAHVYGAKSRFMTDKVMDCFERVSFRGSRASDTLSPSDATVAGAAATVDVGAQLKEMW